jgi:AAA+ ATPase superfamily predicted ATPase
MMQKMDSKDHFLGREYEIARLSEIAARREASIVVVHGRRRVGKTSLVHHVFGKRNLIKLEGIEGESRTYQINSFLQQLAHHFKEPLLQRMQFKTWREPLMELAERTSKGPCTIFLEELQWLAHYENDLISELKFVWDNYLQHNKDLILILCGSSPSFMISNVLRSKALYNRSLSEVALKPFSLKETRMFLGPKFNSAAALEAYLMVGGIPEYLKYLKQDSSVYLSFCKNAFLPGAFFSGEPERLFVSTLAKSLHYAEIVEFIGKQGVTSREQILKKLKISSGSNVTRLLSDLELSSIISTLTSFNSAVKSKLIRYEIADPYLRLYYRYIASRVKEINAGAFKSNSSAPLSLRDLSQALGYAFEHYCRQNAHLIAKALGFSAVEYKAGPLLSRELQGGVQLDLVFSRKDKVVTVCEIKYLSGPVELKQVKDFRQRLARLKLTPTQRLETVLIVPFGAQESVRASGLFDRILDLEGLQV